MENDPLVPIPLPDYEEYKSALCQRHALSIPLKPVPFFPRGMLRNLPPPLDQEKQGWPWTTESAMMFNRDGPFPKLSIVIPSYQQGLYIEQAIRSVLLQNYPQTELIIMDGNSTDETVAVLEYYRDFISLFISETDRGQSHAINKGFAIASGDVLYWLNSDDYLMPDSINKTMLMFQNDAALDIVYGDGILFDQMTGKSSPARAPIVFERYLRFGGIVLSHSVLWRKRVHRPVWEDLNCAMDAELWLRLFPKKKLKHCHFAIGAFRVHPRQKTSDNEKWAKRWSEDFELYIWKHYHPINRYTWKWRTFEFRIVQKIHHFIYYKLTGMARKITNTA
jgi:glycosyltransferase involved in cell wall biosynthesis